jgi:hypothetical protein
VSAEEVCAPAISVLEIDERHAVKVSRWIESCGGVAVWGCLDLATRAASSSRPRG